jgi:transposase
VSRHPHPPDGFECAYRNACPYLDRLSTTWVYGEYRRFCDGYPEQLRILDHFQEALQGSRERIRALEKENAELNAKLQALHQRQFKANRKPKDPSNARNSQGEENRGKKRGAPLGHPGWFRPKPLRVDQTIVVPAPIRCPHCHGDHLTPLCETTDHVQEDVSPAPLPRVTRYVHHQAWCPRCGKAVIQPGDNEMPGAHIGPLAKATAIYLRQEIGIPYRKVQRIFQQLFGLPFVPASALGFDRRATAKGTAIYEDLKEKIRVSPVVHVDETSWRSDGLGHFAWYAGNDHLALFHIDRHRSAAVARSLFGEHFAGVLVRDRYAAYNGIGRDWQACLAHIRRNAKDIGREHLLLPTSQHDPRVVGFVANVQKLCSELCDLGHGLRSGEIPWEAAAPAHRSFCRRLTRICAHRLAFSPAETLRTYLRGPDHSHLFTFLRHPGVSPTNNHAEQSVRRLVIFRKVSFGTRSLSGLKTHSVLPSLVLTAKRQRVDPIRWLQILLTRDTPTAQAALYNNTS